ncbi:hypothetical protein HGRIS_007003 [Hohenbuehelia grisea]|uniref:Cytochrome P450 n=1 Tax=Hohenbuehelia grisea TaxID=104357 RepID=A0ABR3JAV7_9AGAR
MGWQNASTHMRYGPRFRKHRRFAQQTFNQQAIRHFRSLQHQELGILLNGMVDTPEAFLQSIRRYAAATIMKITYGHDVKSSDDLFVQLAEKAGTATIESGTPAATLVDFLPLMKYVPTWMPGAGFKRNALKCRELVQRMMDVPFQKVKQDMENGIASPSFTSALLEPHIKAGENTLSKEDENDIRGAAGTLYAAAEDTTVSVMHTFILAMLLHPAVFQKAQAEMDQVVGQERLPTFEDLDSLPYLSCVLKEVYRWNVPVPLGLPHRLMEDDVYQGNHIPQGSMVIANIWAMSRNCASPDQFYPERYVEEPDLPDPRNMVFGFGRR